MFIKTNFSNKNLNVATKHLRNMTVIVFI